MRRVVSCGIALCVLVCAPVALAGKGHGKHKHKHGGGSQVDVSALDKVLGQGTSIATTLAKEAETATSGGLGQSLQQIAQKVDATVAAMNRDAAALEAASTKAGQQAAEQQLKSDTKQLAQAMTGIQKLELAANAKDTQALQTILSQLTKLESAMKSTVVNNLRP
ncbi:MAG: hypothetical protein ABUS54_06265 [Actinomycetota bacterium]